MYKVHVVFTHTGKMNVTFSRDITFGHNQSMRVITKYTYNCVFVAHQVKICRIFDRREAKRIYKGSFKLASCKITSLPAYLGMSSQ